MILYDLMQKLIVYSPCHVQIVDECDNVIYDDSSKFLWEHRSDLMPYRISHASTFALGDDIEGFEKRMFNLDEDVVCDLRFIIDVEKPTIFTKLKYKFLTIYQEYFCRNSPLDYIKYKLKIILTRKFIDEYYLPDNIEFSSSSTITTEFIKPIGSRLGGQVNTYTADNNSRYKFPIFRIVVIQHNNSDVYKLSGPLSGKKIEPDLVDITMVFTLEQEPKPLQNYIDVKERLKGNIISEERLNQLIGFVKDNYDLFIEAWYIHPSQFGTFSKGFDESKLKPIEFDDYI